MSSPARTVGECSTSQVRWLTITDDGGGPRELRIRPGVGIPGMEARIQRLGGSFGIKMSASGTQVSAFIPADAIVESA